MDWNLIQLQIRNMYDKLNISFTPFFLESLQLFKDRGYKKVLDIGCGYGKHSIYLSENGFNVSSVDTSLQALKWLKESIDKKSIDNISLIKADINNLPFEDRCFDAVICSSVIHHQCLKQIQNSISEIQRVLKPKGCLLSDFLSKEDDSFGVGKEVEINTFVGSRKGEEDIPHHYTDTKELNELLEGFMEIKIEKNEYHIIIDSEKKIISRVFDVLAYK